jgi:amino acid permease
MLADTEEDSPFDPILNAQPQLTERRWSDVDAAQNPHESVPDKHTYTAFVAYCFNVNYILGVGVLGVPYAFYQGGYVLSPIILFLVSLMALATGLWLGEVMARAECFVSASEKRHEQSIVIATHSSPRLNLAGKSPVLAVAATRSPSDPLLDKEGREAAWLRNQPAGYEITHRKFEVNQLVNIFMGKNHKRFYEMMVAIYLMGALWSYSSVFASSFAAHVALPFLNEGLTCNVYTDFNAGCSHLYLFYLGAFAVVVIPLTTLDLTEMKLMQVILSIFRFLCLAIMMITSAYAIANYRNPELHEEESQMRPPYLSDIKPAVWSGLAYVFPIAIYAQIFHHSAPGIVQPMRDKQKIPHVFTGVLCTTFLFYSALGIIVGLYYGSSVAQTCTLNWASYSGSSSSSSRPGWAVFLSYLIVLFPTFDIISAFSSQRYYTRSEHACGIRAISGKASSATI